MKIISKLILCLFLLSNFAFAAPKEVPKLKKNPSIFQRNNVTPWAVTMLSVILASTGLIAIAKNHNKNKTN